MMINKERLTIKYDGLPVPKELCAINKYGNVFCDGCKTACSRLFGDCDNCPIQKCFNKLAELEDKIENGTLIELPCKVGDTLYMPWHWKDSNGIASLTVETIIHESDHIYIQTDLESDDEDFMKANNNGKFNINQIGSSLFVNHDDAKIIQN